MLRTASSAYVRGMEETPRSDLVIGAVMIAESRLRSGQELAPFMITDRLGDALEEFEGEDPGTGQARFREYVRTAAGDEACALVYVGHVDLDEEAIVIERGQAGRQEAELFVQRFRPRRGLLRGFKLVGEPTPVGQIEPVR
jgi:hypothetical protein